MRFAALARPSRAALAVLAALVALLPSACDEPAAPYLEIRGGGFVFNYRIAETHYGLVAEASRELPEGSVVRAFFEDPSGGEPLRVAQAVHPGQRRFVLQTPPLRGVRSGVPYRVELQVVTGADGSVVETHERSFTSSLSQDVLPDAPLTLGPGYAPNPGARRR